MTALTDRPLTDLELRNMPALLAAAGVEIDGLPESAQRALRFLSGWDETTTAGIADLFSAIRLAAERGPADGLPPGPSEGRAGSPGAVDHECNDDICCGCGQPSPVDRDEIGLGVGPVGGDYVHAEEHGFCSTACFVAYVRRRWQEER